MLDSIGENISLTLTIFLRILLGTEYDGLASMQSVNPINDFIKPFHLLELFGIYVKEVLLNWRISTDAHNDDTCFLILVALTIDVLQDLVSCLDNGYSGTCWGN